MIRELLSLPGLFWSGIRGRGGIVLSAGLIYLTLLLIVFLLMGYQSIQLGQTRAAQEGAAAAKEQKIQDDITELKSRTIDQQGQLAAKSVELENINSTLIELKVKSVQMSEDIAEIKTSQREESGRWWEVFCGMALIVGERIFERVRPRKEKAA